MGNAGIGTGDPMKHSETVQLARVMEALEKREQRVLLRIAKRLLEGQIHFGALTKDKKDWRKEAHEEAMDASVYLSALLEDMS
jgi:hypothetical protein